MEGVEGEDIRKRYMKFGPERREKTKKWMGKNNVEVVRRKK